MDTYLKIFNSWLRGMDAVAREGFDISREAGTGERVDATRFFDTMRKAYNDVTTSVKDSLKDTPFSAINEVDRALKNSLDSLPEEQRMAREFFQEIINFNAKLMNITTAAMRQAVEGAGSIMETGTIPLDGARKLIDAYSESLIHLADISRLPASSVPEYRSIIEGAGDLAKATLDLSTSWLETNLKLYQGISRSSDELTRIAQEFFKDGETPSAERLYQKWTSANQDATDVLVKNTRIFENVPRYISSYTDWIRAASKMYQGFMAQPYATRQEMETLSRDMRKVKDSMVSKEELDEVCFVVETEGGTTTARRAPVKASKRGSR